MAIENVKQLRTVSGVTQAPRLLVQSWQILTVCVMQASTSQYAEYHLGNAADSKTAPKHPTAADAARANNL